MKLSVETSAGAATASPEGNAPSLSFSKRTAGKRLEREWKTMQAMVRCYCRAHHAAGSALCGECQGLLDYAARQLERCRLGGHKPTCGRCPVHCYQRQWREQTKTVMRYAGPRMLWRHPILSLRHWLDGFRQAPATSASESRAED